MLEIVATGSGTTCPDEDAMSLSLLRLLSLVNPNFVLARSIA